MVRDCVEEDPHFINCDLDSVRWRDTEWFSIEGIRIRTPREDPGSAVVVVGPQSSFDWSAVENVQGWFLGLELGDDGVDARQLSAVISRLGVEPAFVLVLVHSVDWRLVRELRDSRSEIFVVYLNDSLLARSSDQSNQSVQSESEINELVRFVHSSPLMERNTVILQPDSAPSSELSHRIVSFPSHLVRSNAFGGNRRLVSLLSGAVAALRGHGDPAAYFRSVFTHRGYPPSEQWLVDAAGESSIARTSGVRLSLEEAGLLLYGFDVRQTRLAHSWSARHHEFKVCNGGIEVISKRLGTLRREVLDTLPVHVDTITNSYGAFSFPNAQPMSLESLSPGSYILQLVDEHGDDLLPYSHRTYGAMRVSSSGRSYELLDKSSHIGLLVI